VKNKLLTCYSASMALTALILGTTGAFAQSTMEGPLTPTEIANLFAGGTTGPPPSATFQDPTPGAPPGPGQVVSGTPTPLFGGPLATPAANSVLLVLSATSTDVNSLGSIKLGFDSAANSPVTFSKTDFFTDTFPTGISGIANGAVNGINFYGDAATPVEHAAVDIVYTTIITPQTLLGDVTITSPINLRGDVFSDFDGKIVDSAANSGALGVAPIPEPSRIALFGVGAIGLMGVMVMRHRRHHCTSE